MTGAELWVKVKRKLRNGEQLPMYPGYDIKGKTVRQRNIEDWYNKLPATSRLRPKVKKLMNPAIHEIKKVTVKTPLQDYPAKLVLMDINDIQASHLIDYTKNPNYRYVNERDYSRDKEEQNKIRYMVDNFDPEFLVANSPTASDGAPIIDKYGNVLGGNSRVIALKTIYRDNENKYTTTIAKKVINYIKAIAESLPEKWQARNMSGEALEFYDPNMKNNFRIRRPVLVRMIDKESFSEADADLAIRALNEGFTQALNINAKAVTLSKRISESYLEELAGLMDEHDSLSELYQDGRSVTRLIQILHETNLISRVTQNEYVEAGSLNDLGKTLIENVLFAKLFPDPVLLQLFPKELRRKLLPSIVSLLKIKALPDEWDITGALPVLAEYEIKRRSSGLSLPDYIVQLGMFGDDVSPEYIPAWKYLDFAGSRKLKNDFTNYLNSAESNQGEQMFEALTPDQVQDRIFNFVWPTINFKPVLKQEAPKSAPIAKTVKVTPTEAKKAEKLKTLKVTKRQSEFIRTLIKLGGSSNLVLIADNMGAKCPIYQVDKLKSLNVIKVNKSSGLITLNMDVLDGTKYTKVKA